MGCCFSWSCSLGSSSTLTDSWLGCCVCVQEGFVQVVLLQLQARAGSGQGGCRRHQGPAASCRPSCAAVILFDSGATPLTGKHTRSAVNNSCIVDCKGICWLCWRARCTVHRCMRLRRGVLEVQCVTCSACQPHCGGLVAPNRSCKFVCLTGPQGCRSGVARRAPLHR